MTHVDVSLRTPDAPVLRGRLRRLSMRTAQSGIALVLLLVGLVGLATPAGPFRAGRTLVSPAGSPTRAAGVQGTTPGATVAAADPEAPALIAEPDLNQPDAFVLVTKSGYYLYSSQVSILSPPISVSYSKTLGRWSSPRSAMAIEPSWAVFGFTWGPDVSRIDGRYVLYFDALAVHSYPGADGQCLGVATAASPLGPFRPTPAPLVCQPGLHGAIDPRTFVGPSGGRWLLWKSDDNSDFQGPTDVTHIFSQRLSRNGLSLLGPQYELLSADEPWQHRIIESPDLVEAAGNYWLFYSGGWYNQPYYGIGLARCAGPAGPCTDLSATPWLASNAQGQGPGEESLFDDREGSTWMVYSPTAFLPGDDIRPVALARVAFTSSGPELLQPVLPGSDAVRAARPSSGARRACPCEVH